MFDDEVKQEGPMNTIGAGSNRGLSVSQRESDITRQLSRLLLVSNRLEDRSNALFERLLLVLDNRPRTESPEKKTEEAAYTDLGKALKEIAIKFEMVDERVESILNRLEI